MNKLLAFCDSPTVNTGFGIVARNLLNRWQPHFHSIDVWGINYSGWPHELPYRIYPAGFGDWSSPVKLSQFLNLLRHPASDYTHLWVLADTNNIALNDLPKHIRAIADKKAFRSVYYFPVDSPLRKEWLTYLRCFDSLATYTHYGEEEFLRCAPPGATVNVIPHGVDTAQFKPLPDRAEIRKARFSNWLKPDDILLLNVNRHERRKAIHHSMEIVRRLVAGGVPAKLLLHMRKQNADEQNDLELMADNLGVPRRCWSHTDEARNFSSGGNPMITDAGLNEMYNAADFVISTSLGEGWGLSISEGVAAGAQVVVPNHTSCGELARTLTGMGQTNIHTVPLLDTPIVNPLDISRVRYPVDIAAAVETINTLAESGAHRERLPLTPAAQEWMDWNRVADEFLKLFSLK